MTFIDTSLRRATASTRPTLMQRLAVWRTRRALSRLDAAGLADIGVTPARAEREAIKTVWDVPASWTAR